MKLRPATVVIPVYKSIPDADERASLKQCCRVLGCHPIVLVTSPQLDISAYDAVFRQYHVVAERRTFDTRFFASIGGYNELMLDAAFYRAFSDTEYILIHQLDAWVFRDELLCWCSKDYDYIGAPWFKRNGPFASEKKLFAVGNGGFSLRRVRACLDVLEHRGPFKKRLRDILGKRHNRLIVHLKRMYFNRLQKLKFANTVDFFRSVNLRHEDLFWGLDTQGSHVPFRVAPLDEAIRFAFESHPRLLFELNGDRLPFGCHAWHRHEPDFWARWISR